jgi:hypothetical protein
MCAFWKAVYMKDARNFGQNLEIIWLEKEAKFILRRDMHKESLSKKFIVMEEKRKSDIYTEEFKFNCKIRE